MHIAKKKGKQIHTKCLLKTTIGRKIVKDKRKINKEQGQHMENRPNMVDMNTTISIIILNCSFLNATIKDRNCETRYIKKKKKNKSQL